MKCDGMLSLMNAKHQPGAQPVRIRPSIAALPRYVAGARAPESDLFKLSSNETAYAPLPSVLEVIMDSATHANRYPHLTATPVAEALVYRFDVDGTVPEG